MDNLYDSHRLRTVSATQAFQDARSQGSRSISTGLERLDTLLQEHVSIDTSRDKGGLARGQITEIYGPPGAGKTAFALQACTRSLQTGHHVVWLDAGPPLAASRLRSFIHAAESKDARISSSASVNSERFERHATPTLPHLLAMFTHPTASFPRTGTALIVVDNISTLFDGVSTSNAEDADKHADVYQWTVRRRYTVMNDLMSSMRKMAVMRDLAVLVTVQPLTRIRAGAGTVLLPSLTSKEWDAGVHTRIVVFQDWAALPLRGSDTRKEIRRARHISVIKQAGLTANDGQEVFEVVTFEISGGTIEEAEAIPTQAPRMPFASPARLLKRSFSKIADSEDEDIGSDDEYGWAEEDQLAAEGLIGEPGSSEGTRFQKP